ncbi:MAG: hypothetical protein K0S00_1944 [Xanthobacteraceae bacterium]|nr:hypothetical protein [Xanthobacteraceae bacterium]
MKKTEETARELCRLDLLRMGLPENEARTLVERFWPVLANEIRQGIVVGEWPFTEAEIQSLSREYQALLNRRLPAREHQVSDLPAPTTGEA